MKAPVSWLKKYVGVNVPLPEYCDKMVMSGTGVESVESLYADMTGVVVGKILSVEKHPEADKLFVCQVDAGNEPITIVTGADNVYESALVPVALHGSTIPGGVKIKRSKLRGIESHGMMMSGAELNLTGADEPGADADGILILDGNYTPGEDIRTALELSEDVVEFEIGANRPDCLSMTGIAREMAVTLGTRLTLPERVDVPGVSDINEYVSVEVLDNELCPRYMAGAVVDIKIEPSPRWMRRALSAAGVRPINNIVDITNYVMLETGQPMHAFDASCIRGNKIIVRRANAGETLVSLDGKLRKLTPDMLVIADTKGAIGLAGVMGGENSEIVPETKTVIFESANFLGSNIRQTSRALGIPSEAAARFSKGVAVNVAEIALSRALELVALLGAGTVISGSIDIYGTPYEKKVIEAGAKGINALLGIDMKACDMADILKRLYIETKVDGDTLTCSIPPWRGDMEGEADVAEEIARIYGYDNIPSTPMRGVLIPGGKNDLQKYRGIISNTLVSCGLQEAYCYSFMSPRDFDRLNIESGSELRKTVAIENPLGEDFSLMRTTMLPAMLTALSTNLSRKNAGTALFEMGRIYLANGEGLPHEREAVCIGLDGSYDFFALKGIFETLFSELGVSAGFKEGGAAYFHPFRKAEMLSGDMLLGELGQIHPAVAKAYGIEQDCYIGYVYLEELTKAAHMDRQFTPIPKYQRVMRDIAVVVDERSPAGPMMDAIRVLGGSLIEDVRLFDVYTGVQAGKGKKSVAFSIGLRAENHTLTDDEITRVMDKVTALLEKDFHAVQRK